VYGNEAQTRRKLIDPLLIAAGWDIHDRTQVGIEIPVDGYDAEPWNGVTDYCSSTSWETTEKKAVVSVARFAENAQESELGRFVIRR